MIPSCDDKRQLKVKFEYILELGVGFLEHDKLQ